MDFDRKYCRLDNMCRKSDGMVRDAIKLDLQGFYASAILDVFVILNISHTIFLSPHFLNL